MAKLFGIVCVALWALTTLLNAQSSLGSIVGAVQDPSGAPVPGARVTIVNIETNQSSVYETDNTGSYFIPSLIPGHYRIEAEKQGCEIRIMGFMFKMTSASVNG